MQRSQRGGTPVAAGGVSLGAVLFGDSSLRASYSGGGAAPPPPVRVGGASGLPAASTGPPRQGAPVVAGRAYVGAFVKGTPVAVSQAPAGGGAGAGAGGGSGRGGQSLTDGLLRLQR
jgi:hypothetical protein